MLDTVVCAAKAALFFECALRAAAYAADYAFMPLCHAFADYFRQ